MARQVLTDIAEVTQSEFARLANYALKNNKTITVIGPSGAGKTEISTQVANQVLIDFAKETEEEPGQVLYLNASALERPDLIGMPVVEELSNKQKVTRYAAPEFLPQLAPGAKPKNILVLDEIDKALSELQNPLLEVVQFRTLNGVPLDIKAIIMTSNRPDENAMSRPISHALLGRGMVFVLNPTLKDWKNWAMENDVSTLIISFLVQSSEYFYKPPKTDPTAYCYPTPRRWYMASQELRKMQKDADRGKLELDYRLVEMMISGYVGYEASLKFKVWLTHYRELFPSVKNLILHNTIPEDLSYDQNMILLCSAVDEVSKLMNIKGGHTPAEHEIQSVHKYLDNVCKYAMTLQPDVQALAFKGRIGQQRRNMYRLSEVESYKNIMFSIFNSYGAAGASGVESQTVTEEDIENELFNDVAQYSSAM